MLVRDKGCRLCGESMKGQKIRKVDGFGYCHAECWREFQRAANALAALGQTVSPAAPVDLTARIMARVGGR